MTKQNTTKKHIVTSFHNLSVEMQEAVREQYPLGFSDAMMRIDKPNGDFFYAVPFDTEEIEGADEIQDDGGSDRSEENDDDVDI